MFLKGLHEMHESTKFETILFKGSVKGCRERFTEVNRALEMQSSIWVGFSCREPARSTKDLTVLVQHGRCGQQ